MLFFRCACVWSYWIVEKYYSLEGSTEYFKEWWKAPPCGCSVILTSTWCSQALFLKWRVVRCQQTKLLMCLISKSTVPLVKQTQQGGKEIAQWMFGLLSPVIFWIVIHLFKVLWYCQPSRTTESFILRRTVMHIYIFCPMKSHHPTTVTMCASLANRFLIKIVILQSTTNIFFLSRE